MHRWPLLTLLLPISLAAHAQQSASCTHLATLSLPQVKILSASVAEAGTFTPPGPPDPASSGIYSHLPAFCRVTAQSTPSPDSDIRIEVWLPLEHWNGKFRGQGNGGFAGEINYRLLALSVSQHYASAGTDTGHTGTSTDAAWALNHPEKINDFGFRGIHRMTTTARAVISAFYSKPPTRAYFASCSDGGREALMEAQRFPEDYDGILAGAPAYYWTNMLSSGAHKLQVLTRTPESFIPPAKVPAIAAAVVAQCDAADGVNDGILNDPRQCHFKPEALLCKGAESNDCLTAPQLATLKTIYASTKDAEGHRIYPGSLPGGEEGPGGWATWVLGDTPDKSLGYQFETGYFADLVYSDPHWDFKSFSLDNGLKMAELKTAAALNATDPNLRSFSSHGGKLILYHGWNDPAISPLSTIDYFNHVNDINGDAGSFVRLFMVPGMQHCYGGPGPSSFGQFGYQPGTGPDDPRHDLYLALEDWVEKGAAPGEVIAAKIEPKKDAAGKVTPAITMTRPLCAYPQVAKYKGTGDTSEAANFTCTAP
jgi:feruloyl esterase